MDIISFKKDPKTGTIVNHNSEDLLRFNQLRDQSRKNKELMKQMDTVQKDMEVLKNFIFNNFGKANNSLVSGVEST